MNQLVSYISNLVSVDDITAKFILSFLIVIVAYILIKLCKRLLDKAINCQKQENSLINPQLVQVVYKTLKAVVFYGGFFIAFLIILEVFEISIFRTEDFKGFGFQLVRVIAILIGAKLLIQFKSSLVEHWIAKSQEGKCAVLTPKVQTLGSLVNSILTYSISFIAGLMILEAFNVNTTAILASVGVLGLAVGFGAQNLVRDVISGFFIIFEDQLRVGEFVEAGGAIGIVEEIGLRTTKIKRWTGHLEIIPNGAIARVVNYSRSNMLAVCVVGIAYEMDIDKAQEILRSISEKAYKEIDAIVEIPVVQGITGVTESNVNVRVIARTIPGEQWAVERDLLTRFKKGLDEEGYPRRAIHSEGGNNL